MTTYDNEAPPARGAKHEALAAFLGEWKAQGTSHGPQGDQPWTSTHTGRWHSGEFFLVQDEKANGPFDTLSILGVDARTGQYFASTFENHGFHRHYSVAVTGRVWTFSGQTERARYEFSEDGNTQTIRWEWKPQDKWLPLCERVATRVKQP